MGENGTQICLICLIFYHDEKFNFFGEVELFI